MVNQIINSVLTNMLLSGELNDALSGRLFYADFGFPQGYQSL